MSQAIQEVSLQVNTTQLFSNLKFAFTSKYTVIAELVQNGRRAGATEIEVRFEDGELTVIDNGAGIDDMQNLLTVAESGWTQDVKDADRPYGLGFLSALYAAKRVHVESRGQKVEFDTESILNCGTAAIERGFLQTGTLVKLSGMDLEKSRVEGYLETLATGYPVDIRCNGKLLESPRREDAAMVATPVGKVYLGGVPEYVAYLQGVRVMSTNQFGRQDACVVHLDSTRYTGRLPDRDTLVDANEADKDVKAAIKQVCKDMLLAKKASMPAEAFVRECWGIASAFGLIEVMDDVPYLPGKLVSQFIDAPIQADAWEYLSQLKDDVLVTREDVESGKVRLCSNPAEDVDDETCFASTMYAWRKGWLEIPVYKLGQGHWARHHVINLVKLDAEVLFEELSSDGHNGAYVYAGVITCESYRIVVNGDMIEVKDASIALDDRTILVPRGCDGRVGLAQISTFEDEWNIFQSEDFDEEVTQLAQLVRVLFGEAPEVTLKSVLSEANLHRHDNLVGKTFLVHAPGIDEAVPVVEMAGLSDALRDAMRWMREAGGAESSAYAGLEAILAKSSRLDVQARRVAALSETRKVEQALRGHGLYCHLLDAHPKGQPAEVVKYGSRQERCDFASLSDEVKSLAMLWTGLKMFALELISEAEYDALDLDQYRKVLAEKDA